ncbi:hypothetical protein NQ315_012519 [Exocentrus adspersus]|uniref:Kinesin motor domain-containing protein n=1 Tax=Exocentrus adspersus TaxID=1586481 RepID=A0AAV8VCM9_9CUCU|nr:hypothetical protein NQ315_012519 [Exocentrus adspersus]
MNDTCSVKVAVRIRPLVPSEIAKGCKEILEVVEENEQIIVRSIDKDKPFTFNYVFPTHIGQEQMYERCVRPLIDNLFKDSLCRLHTLAETSQQDISARNGKSINLFTVTFSLNCLQGYNVTILAYGQTGSGKTHSMGTAYKGEEDMGVIPRAVTEIFDFIKDHFTLDFSVTVSFMELYQEVLYDLLSDKARDQSVLEIREDTVKVKTFSYESSDIIFEGFISNNKRGIAKRVCHKSNVEEEAKDSLLANEFSIEYIALMADSFGDTSLV